MRQDLMKKRSFVPLMFAGLLLSSPMLVSVVSASPGTVALNPQPVPPQPIASCWAKSTPVLWDPIFQLR
jgi:hypothetical protein